MNKLKIGIFLYRIFSRAYFYLPFLLIYFYQNGYSIIKIEILIATYGASAFLFSLCKNYIYKYVNFVEPAKLLISELVKITGLALLLLQNQYYILLLAQLILGISYSMMSGVDSIIIKRYFDFDNDENIQNKSNSLMFLSLLFSGIIGSYLYEINEKLPIIVTILFSILTSLIIFTTFIFKEQNENNHIVKEKNNYSFNNSELFWVLHYGVLRGIILGFFIGFLPLYLFVNWKLNTTQFILILACYSISGFISSQYFVKYMNFKFLSEVNLILFLIFFSYQSIFTISTSMIFLGVSSGLTRPQTIKEISKSAYFVSIMNLSEKIYFIINTVFLITGAWIYQIGAMNYILVYIFTIFFIYLLIIGYIRSDNNENKHRI